MPWAGRPSKTKSGVMGDGVCIFADSDDRLRTRRGVGGEPIGEEV